eukprot:scaffold1245_cov122-Isochrysis_galbana.AAC.6
MVSSSLDPSLPTAAELAGDTPADGMNIDQPSERQGRAIRSRAARSLPTNTTLYLLAFMQEPQQSPSTLHRVRVQAKTQQRASYASDLSAASHSHSCEFTQSNPSPQSGMVQPVVNEMFATVHAAGSSLLGLFTSCTTFDLTCAGSGRAPGYRAGA